MYRRRFRYPLTVPKSLLVDMNPSKSEVVDDQEIEGVIRYRIDFTPAPAPQFARIAELNAWRGILYRLGLTGHEPHRYGGLAYGNVSQRMEPDSFLISGTQTGGQPVLGPEHYCRVTRWNLADNRIVANGPLPPSSEALTHAAAYAANGHIRCVLHVHSPEIWSQAERRGTPCIPAGIGYGTPEMAQAVEALLHSPECRLIAMLGHRDGLIAVGETPEQAAWVLIRTLAQTRQVQEMRDTESCLHPQ